MIKSTIISIFSISFIYSVEAYTLMNCYASLPSDAGSLYHDPYQSSGLCNKHCDDTNYFALSDGGDCYCFDSAPTGDTVNSCNIGCFGYDSEMCGGASSFSVYTNDEDEADEDENESSSSVDSATQTDSVTDATTSSSSSALQDQTTVTDSTTVQEPQVSSNPTTLITSTTTSSSQDQISSVLLTTSSSTSSSSTSTSKRDPVTSIVTHSANGVTSIVTITTTPTFDAKLTGSSSSNKGAIIGGAVGGAVGGAALIAIVVVLLWFFKRRSNDNDDDSVDTFVDDAIYDEAIKRQPGSNPFDSPEDYNMNVDQRLNPIELGNRRLSEGSLADHADYSRKILRVANPDDNV